MYITIRVPSFLDSGAESTIADLFGNILDHSRLYHSRHQYVHNPLFNTLATPTHAHLMRAVAVQQEQSSQLDAEIVGAVVHVASTVYGIDAVTGAKLGSVTALTRTGIAPPVDSPKSRWPITCQAKVSTRAPFPPTRTWKISPSRDWNLGENCFVCRNSPRKILAISPEWLVMEI